MFKLFQFLIFTSIILIISEYYFQERISKESNHIVLFTIIYIMILSIYLRYLYKLLIKILKL